MSAGLIYLTAKALEYTATIDWTSAELSGIPNLTSSHFHIAQELNRRMTEARGRISQLNRVVQLNRAALVPRGVSVVNELQYDVFVLSESYLPALKREGASEAEFGRLAIKAARQCGLTDIQDIVVSLSGGHAVLPAILTCPLLFAPPHQRHTLIDLSSIYHEFGHIVFEAQRGIRAGLTRVCADFFRTLEQAGGFLGPAEREERRKQMNQALGYWTTRRLAETFCDIFATYTTGPAYFYSCVDMAIRYRDDPYEIDISDEHPPMAARVSVCRKALSSDHVNSEIGQRASALWDEHVRSKKSSSEFRLWCGDELLENIVNQSVGALSGLGAFRRYSGTGYHPHMAPVSDINLEELLNESVRMFLRDPGGYAAWERPFVDAIFQ